MKSLGIGTALFLFVTGSPAYAAVTEFVSNGDFEMNGGNGQLGFNTSGTSADNSGAVALRRG